MKEMKRILSLFLCLAMLVGYFPVGVLAAEDEAATEPSAAAVVETTEAVVETTEAAVETTETVIETTEAVVETTEATVETTEAAVEETTEATVPETTEATVPETTEATVPETTEETEPEETTPVRKPVKKASKVKKEATGESTETVVDAAIFFSDLHTSKGNYKTDKIDSVFGSMKATGLPFSTVTSVGDAFSSNETAYTDTTANITGPIQDVMGNIPVYYAWSDHDRGADIENFTGLLYGDDSTNYYIYAISMSDMTADTRYGVASTYDAQKLTDFTETVAELDPSKPLFVVTHVPLHDRRDDNQYADEWYGVISAAADQMDVAVFWGHNHTSEASADREAYYIAKDGTEKITIADVGSVVPNFTYANAGYMNDSTYNSSSTCEFVATAVKITEDNISYTLYGESGEHSCSYHENATVAREFKNAEKEETQPAEKKISYILINKGEGAAYAIGESPLFELLVYYTDGTSETVNQSVCQITDVTTVSDGESIALEDALNTPGQYSAVLSYQGVAATTKLTFTINEKSDFEGGVTSYDTLSLIIGGATLTADVKNVTDQVTVENVTNYVAYDISATLAEGATATVSVPVPAEWVVGELGVLYIDDDGNVTDEEFAVTYADGYATFQVTHFSTYVVTNTAKTGTESDVVNPGETTKVAEEVTVYKRVSAPEAGEQYLIVNSANGTGYGLDGDTSGYVTTAFTGGEDYYSTWDAEAQSGTQFAAGSDVYLDTASAYLWTAGNNTFAIGYNRRSSMVSYSYTLNPAGGTTGTWSLSNNRLSISLASNAIYGSSTYYLSNSNATWSMATSGASNVYFYEPVTIYKVTETSTSTTTTYGINILMNGTAASAINANNVMPGDSVDLEYEIYSEPAGSTLTGGTVTWSVLTQNGVASVDQNGLVTFTGASGTETIEVSYTWTGIDNKEHTISNNVTITATAMGYSVTVSGAAEMDEYTTTDLTAAVVNTEGTAITDGKISWISSDTSVATVDANGKVTAVAAGTAVITATWTRDGKTANDTHKITVNQVISDQAVLTGLTVTGVTDYELGDTFYLDHMVVTATYDDHGTTKTQILTPDQYSISGDLSDNQVLTGTGEKSVTVSYTYGDTTKTADHKVTVTEVPYNSVTVNGTTSQEKTIYVLANSLEEGEEYVIVNPNKNQALSYGNGSQTSTAVTVVQESIVLDGTTYTEYLENPDSTALWVYNSDGRLVYNDSYYLRRNNSDMITGTESSGAVWTYSNNNLKSGNYYVRYSGSSWSGNGTTAGTVYLYRKVTGSVPVTTQITYAMRAADLTKIVSATSNTAKIDYCLQGNGADLTALPSGGSYSFTEVSDPNNIISSIAADGTITFNTDAEGEATVKVAYTWTADGETYTVYRNITVVAKQPYYSLEITTGTGDDLKVVSGTTIPVKGVTETTTLDLNAQLKFIDENGSELVDLTGATIYWEIPEEYQRVATIDEDGVVHFEGVNGAFYATASVTVDGKTYTAGVNISATIENYMVPEDGTDDFPEYPNEGAVRYDKTATAVGNFAETGIAKIELSVTGVPFVTGSEMDVVLMLDRSSSMQKVSARIPGTIAATKTFVENIVKNEDGSFNNNRIIVMDFLGGNLNTSEGGGSSHVYQSNYYTIKEDTNYQIINDQNELDALFDRIDDGFVAQGSLYGTEYAQGLKDCYDALAASRADGRQQFCVFMSDGIPNYLKCETTHFESTGDIVDMFTVTNSNQDTAKAVRGGTNAYEYEYYSTQMKKEGVTVFTVGLGLQNTNSAWSGASAAACEQVASMLLNDISGPAGETKQPDATGSSTTSKKDSYFFSVADADAAEGMKDVFSAIAQKILQAATDVTVEDKVDDDYTMIFDIPTGQGDNPIGDVGSDTFYIEFLEYSLDPTTHERLANPTSLSKLYLKDSNGTEAGGTYSAVMDTDGTAYAAPVFENKTIGDKGTLYYWTTDASFADQAGLSYKDGDTTYYFIPYGKKAAQIGDDNLSKWFNMTSGGYAHGTIDEDTNTSTDVVIATPYYVYNAATKMLYWTVDKISTTEYALSYFVYLDGSAADVGVDGVEKPAGTYPTNEYAYLTYTNFNGNECHREFPVPQLTWNGAQVSYVFYLVNVAGQPINRSGQVVDFANASFVTSVYTDSVVWNKDLDGTSLGEGVLSADWLAQDLLPDGYTIYDEKAGYKLHVYENADGSTIKNQFTIEGSTKAEISASLNTRLKLQTTESTVSNATTKVYNTKSGVKYTDYGTYTTAQAEMAGFDFANTTVAFAVVWEPRLIPDTVVVDYGLDVLINVTENDMLDNNGISGIGTDATVYGTTKINTGVSVSTKMEDKPIKLANGDTIQVESGNMIRYTQKDMQFTEAANFYYETPVTFFENNLERTGYMYSSVTVIPATTIYYEDSYLDLKTWKNGTDGWASTDGWVVDTDSVYDETANITQGQDRPGEKQYTEALDADNVYGYDEAYDKFSKYSLGSAVKISVDENTYGTATFTFYGTGFDVVGLTSDKTGGLIIDVYSGSEVTGEPIKSRIVDTFYGYTRDGEGNWVLSDNTQNADNALYQIPVMKVSGLEYGQYTVEINAVYAGLFDHNKNEDGTKSGNYDLYLDAIRIYDPAGTTYDEKDNNGNLVTDGNIDDTIQDAYIKDHEAYPVYQELRNNVIDASDFQTGTINGIVFLDSNDESMNLADYISYGPNNELYLAPGQAVIFSLDPGANEDILDHVHLGMKSADGNPVKYAVTAVTEDTDRTSLIRAATNKLTSATDMYYDITDLKDQAIAIYNAGTDADGDGNPDDGILSLTNIKMTFTEKPAAVETGFRVPDKVIQNIVNKEQVFAPTTNALTVEVNMPTKVKPGETFQIFCTTFNQSSTEEATGKPVVTGITVTGAELVDWKYDENYIVNLKAGTEEGTQDLSITVTTDIGSATVKAQVVVYSFNPTFAVDNIVATAGVSTTITVTTGDDVAAVMIDGQLVKNYTIKDGKRVWKLRKTYDEEGTAEVNVILYSAEGYDSMVYTKTITVTEGTASKAETLRNLVATIVQSLFPWFE